MNYQHISLLAFTTKLLDKAVSISYLHFFTFNAFFNETLQLGFPFYKLYQNSSLKRHFLSKDSFQIAQVNGILSVIILIKALFSFT